MVLDCANLLMKVMAVVIHQDMMQIRVQAYGYDCEEYLWDDCDYTQDCAGVYFGSAMYDACGVCEGGNTCDEYGCPEGTNVANDGGRSTKSLFR